VLDDLGWAAADFERAAMLMKQAMAAGESIDQTWRSGAFRWYLRRRPYRVPDGTSHGPIVPGRWDASLVAGSRDAVWSFSWTGDGWVVLDYCFRGVAKPPPD
jgi:hypothetical protein